MALNGNCNGCGTTNSVVWMGAPGYLCAQCLFTKVDNRAIVLAEERACDSCGEPNQSELVCQSCSAMCASCGDTQAYYCEGCATPVCNSCGNEDGNMACSNCAWDYYGFENEAWCDECGDSGYVLCEPCASEQWRLTPVSPSAPTVVVNDDDTITSSLGDVINWA